MRDVPLGEITLRKYEKASTQEERALIRLLCLSIGLLQPGDSRDAVVDVFHVLLKAKQNQQMMSIEQIEQQVIANREQYAVAISGITASNIRRQVKRLREIYLVEKIKNNYRIAEFLPLKELFSERTLPFVVQGIIKRVEEHFDTIDHIFTNSRQ